MAEVDFMSALHKSTQRDYLARVNDPEFPKSKAAELAKQFDFDYWDGDRRICYGGYRYLEGRWEKVARAMVEHYQLPAKPKILDIGCGKGFLLYDFLKVIPDAEVHGIDSSSYALANSKEEIRDRLQLGSATSLRGPTITLILFSQSILFIACMPRNWIRRCVRWSVSAQPTNILVWRVGGIRLRRPISFIGR